MTTKNFSRTLITAVFVLNAACSIAQQATRVKQAVDTQIRPFRVHFEQVRIDELRRRVLATRWPDAELVADRSQGVKLAKMQALVKHWGTAYNWRNAEAKLNSLPQFTTVIDGLEIHFVHVRSKEANALPLLVMHGWPGSVIEQLKIIGPLTNPTAHGGAASDAFHVVIPSMPGYGFSEKPKGKGWDPNRIAKAWAELMARLGYTHYVAQGGDWGAAIANAMARQNAAGLRGIHINLPATVPPEIGAILSAGGAAPRELSQKEREAFNALETFYTKYRGYAAMMGTRPQTIGYTLTDSPAGLAAWMYDYHNGELERFLRNDEFLDNVTLYWLTNSAASSARLYWETGGQSILLSASQKTGEITLPVAITVFPAEIYRAPESWAKRAYTNLIYFNEAQKGGHFAAWEVPQLLAQELRRAFKSLRNDPAQQPEVKRTQLQRHDLGIPGREVIQSLIEFDAGASFGKHSHPGEEVIYVVEGELEYQVEGKPPVILKAGQVLLVPAGTVHSAKNVGKTKGAELATYIVEKGKPLLKMHE
jgi:quercetin dioxygenase-like cupin family protein